MDVRGESRGELPTAAASSGQALDAASALASEQIAEILKRHEDRELRVAGSFRECRGLSPYQVKELFDETVDALLRRPYFTEKHVCDGLRQGIKYRALMLHRAGRTHKRIFAESAPAIHAAEQLRSEQEGPEQRAIAREDRLVILEFMAGLTPLERRVFLLVIEGMGYNRIAKVAKLEVNEARNAVASCERKRKHFHVLYMNGRLCGYRARTIRSLLDGEATNEQLAALAVAHVERCAHCRAEHKTNAKRLRLAFDRQAAALLPPTLLLHLGWLGRASIFARTLAHRARPHWVSVGQGGTRERAATLLAGGGASAKLATGIVTVAVIAGGTITATHALQHQQQHPHHDRRATSKPTEAAATPPADLAELSPSQPLSAPQHHAPPRDRTREVGGPGHIVSLGHAPASYSASRREPGGFAYLGVPARTTVPASAQPSARAATQTGGPFSP